jgi:hypothetical protein
MSLEKLALKTPGKGISIQTCRLAYDGADSVRTAARQVDAAEGQGNGRDLAFDDVKNLASRILDRGVAVHEVDCLGDYA